MIDVLMPALSPTMEQGKLARWLKKPGEAIKAGDVLAEIETDKATMEVEAVDAGTLAEIVVPEGSDGVAVNAVIARIAGEGEAADAPPSKPKPAKEEPEAPAPKREEPPQPPTSPPPSPPAPEPVREPHTPPAQEARGPAQPAAAKGAKGERVIASPLARKHAAEAGIDLHGIEGSGSGGRIVKADVEQAAKAPKPAGKPATPTGAAAPQGVDARKLAGQLGIPFTETPHSNIRRTIARRLAEAKQTIPHFYLTVDCRIDELLALRGKFNEATEQKISVNDFVIRATALALARHPDVNSAWADDAMLAWGRVDVAVAVATDNGLVTPIIKAADTKSLSAISAEMRELGGRARANKLKPEEYQGGTASISNLGMFGIRQFAAIINPPQASILAIGSGEQRPIVVDGAIVPATLMSVTGAFDHRVVDGVAGAKFLSTFRDLIERPYALLA